MEFIQLEMFVAAAEERSLQRAARRVGRSQPAVSVALTKLEAEAGVPLLVRTRRQGCRLTCAGLVLYEYATRILRLRAEACRAPLPAPPEPPPLWAVPCA